MKLTEKVRKEISVDWNRCFPCLGVYKPLWLMRRVGPIVLGVCLDRDSGNDSYRPTFHVHNLAKEFRTITLTLATPLCTTKGNPISIRASIHKSEYESAASNLYSQTPLTLSGSITYAEILSAYENYMNQPSQKFPFPLYEDILTILLYCGKFDLSKKYLEGFMKNAENWPQSVLAGGGGIDAWEIRCRDWLKDPQERRLCVDSETKKHKLEKLPYSDIKA